LPATTEPVLLGAAMLGAVASGAFASLDVAMTAMSRLGALTRATGPDMSRFHAAKRRVYEQMRRLDRDSRAAMQALELPLATGPEGARCC